MVRSAVTRVQTQGSRLAAWCADLPPRRPGEQAVPAWMVCEGDTDPANAAMRAVFDRVGWTQAGSQTELGREWAAYRITREDWLTSRSKGRTPY